MIFSDEERESGHGGREVLADWQILQKVQRGQMDSYLVSFFRQTKKSPGDLMVDREGSGKLKKKELGDEELENQKDEEHRQECKGVQQKAKRKIAEAVEKMYSELNKKSDTKEGEKNGQRERGRGAKGVQWQR